jgi:hypothetical protein
MIFKHINAGYTFDHKKFSANKENNRYFYGDNPNDIRNGIPNILYDELVFCKERKVIYTHGAFYMDAVEGSYLKQISDLTSYTPKAVDGEIVEYVGETNEDYVNGYLYKYVVSDRRVEVRIILTSSNTNLIPQGDKFSFVKDVYNPIAYTDSAKQYYCYEEPLDGVKVYKIGNPVTEYTITSHTSSSSSYQVALESLTDHTTISVTLKMVAKELWVNSESREVYACTGQSLSGMVQVNGDMYVYITSDHVEYRTNYWKLVVPDAVTSGNGGFKKLIVGNSEINSFDQSTITMNAGVGIQMENTSRGIIISRLSEINDNLTALDYTWSSEKINSVISAINLNNFRVVDQLPTENIDTNVIYIVPKQGGTSPNLREEYIYVNGQWELIGSTDVNLDNYFTKQEVINRLDTKQNVLTAIGEIKIIDNIISVDLHDYYTRGETTNLLALKQGLISGSEGDVAYVSESGIDIVSQTIMSDGYVVDTEEDLALCKNSSPSFETVFSTWKRFSHKDDIDDYKKSVPGSDYNKWTYIPSLDTVSQPNNSAAYTGFISPKSYSNYDITVRVYSDNGDDDFIGLVAAYAKDANGKEHTLSFLRTTHGTGINFTGCGWVCMLDFRAQSSKSQIGINGLQILANKNSTMSIKDTNWAAINNNGASTGGTVINMVRTGNVFSAKCSEFGTSELVNNSLITIDLNDDDLITRYPTLSLFKGASPWGYSTYSQSNSRYQNISITDPNNMIFDLVHKKVLLYNSTTKSWEEKPGYTPIKSVGVGRFSYNTITDKLFYNDGTSITRVATKLTAGNNIEITNEGVISARVNASANNGKLTIKQGDNVLGTFLADQATNTEVVIPQDPVVNDGTLTIKRGITNLGTFNANQSTNTEIELPIDDIKDLPDSTNLKQTWSNKQDPISGTGVISVNNNVVSANLDNYYTKAQVDTSLATKQNTLTGNNGDVMYHNGTSIIPQQIMSGGYVVNTTEDLNLCKNNTPSFETVFNTWRRFDTWGGRDDWGAYKKASGNYTQDDVAVEKWIYDSTLDRVRQPQNSTPYNGFISPESYSNYDIKIRLYSTNTDDDVIGLVAAFAKDSNGKIHTLSFLRSGGGVGSTGGVVYCWGCMLDYNDFNWGSANYNQVLLANNSSNSGYLPKTNSAANTLITGNSNPGWKGLGDGTVIRIVRTGNVFEAWCSEFNSPDLIEASKITIDLDALSSTHSVLNLFKGSSPWGYSTLSQSNSMFENISITSSNLIYDLVNTKVWSYDASQAAWTVITGADPISAMGVGRLNFNNITNKLFYNNGFSIEELSTNPNSMPSVYDSTITLTQGGSTLGSFTLNQSTGKSIDIPAVSGGTTYTAGSNMDLTGNVITAKVDSSLSTTSLFPVQNKVVDTALKTKVTNGRGVTTIYFVDSQADYDSMQKDSNTLYILPIENDNV